MEDVVWSASVHLYIIIKAMPKQEYGGYDMVENTGAKEAVFLINGSRFLHLREAGQDVGYATYDLVSKKQVENGLILYKNLRPDGKYKMETARNWYLYEIFDGEITSLQREGISILDQFPESGVPKRMIWGDKTLPTNDVRIINSHNGDLYMVPDGGILQIDFQDGYTFTSTVKYVDDSHLTLGGVGWPLHVWEFRQIYQDASVYPELLTNDDKAVWRFALDARYVSIRSCDEGWEYTIYTWDRKTLFCGNIAAPELTIEEAREEILAKHDLQKGGRIKIEYDAFFNTKK